MRNVVIAALCTLVCSSSPALAQDTPPSGREERYARLLSQSVGRQVERISRVSIPLAERIPPRLWPASIIARRIAGDKDAEPEHVAPAVQVVLGPTAGASAGLTLTRIKFPSERLARNHLGNEVFRLATKPVMAELRGDQLIMVEGEALRDPEVVRDLRKKMWKGLPTPTPTPDAALTKLGGGTWAITTRLPAEGDSLSQNLNYLRSDTTQYRKEPERLADFAESNRVAKPRFAGRTGTLRTPEGTSFWLAAGSVTPELMQQHLAALGGHPPAGPQAESPAQEESEARGAASVVNGLFGGAP